MSLGIFALGLLLLALPLSQHFLLPRLQVFGLLELCYSCFHMRHHILQHVHRQQQLNSSHHFAQSQSLSCSSSKHFVFVFLLPLVNYLWSLVIRQVSKLFTNSVYDVLGEVLYNGKGLLADGVAFADRFKEFFYGASKDRPVPLHSFLL